MIAELKVYEDCSSPEPTKTYPLYQVTTRVTKQMADFQQKYDKMAATAENYEEIMGDLDFMLKTIFPKLTDEELECVPVDNKNEFVWAIVNHFNKVSNNALKN